MYFNQTSHCMFRFANKPVISRGSNHYKRKRIMKVLKTPAHNVIINCDDRVAYGAFFNLPC